MEEEQELRALMARVMSEPMAPHLEKLEGLEQRVDKLAAEIKKTALAVHSNNESLERRFQSLDEKFDEWQEVVDQVGQQQNELHSIQSVCVDLVQRVSHLDGMISDSSQVLKEIIDKLKGIGAHSRELLEAGEGVRVAVLAGHKITKPALDGLRGNTDTLIASAHDQKLSLLQLEGNLPKSLAALESSITISADERAKEMAVRVDACVSAAILKQQHDLLTKLRPFGIVLLLNVVGLLVVLGILLSGMFR